MNIGERLKKAREEHAFTQEQIAEMLGVTRQSISNWENDKSLPDVLSLFCLSDIYHISLDETLRGSDALEQMNTDINAWKDGYYFCQVSVNHIFVKGSQFIQPQNPYMNHCDFNENRIRIVKFYYSGDFRNEFSLPLNIPYEQIKYAKLFVTRRLIWRYKIKLAPNFRYYFNLQFETKDGLLVHLEMNPLYDMKKAFELLHSHVPFEDTLKIFDTFQNEESFYGGKISDDEKHFYHGGFEAYANAHYEEWKKKYDLLDLIVNDQPFSKKSRDAVNCTHIYKTIPLSEEESRELNGTENTKNLEIGLVIFWIAVAGLLVLINLLIH